MIKNTLGISHIKTAVIVLAVSMMLSAVLTYASLMTVVDITRDNTIRVLDSFVMHNSTEIYDSLKNGTDFTRTLDAVYYKNTLKSELSLDLSGDVLYCIDENGSTKWSMTNPTVTFDCSNTLKLKASYTVIIPVRFAGREITSLRLPQTVKSYYTLKSDYEE